MVLKNENRQGDLAVQKHALTQRVEKSLSDRALKNFKCKAQKKFKLAA